MRTCYASAMENTKLLEASRAALYSMPNGVATPAFGDEVMRTWVKENVQEPADRMMLIGISWGPGETSSQEFVALTGDKDLVRPRVVSV